MKLKLQVHSSVLCPGDYLDLARIVNQALKRSPHLSCPASVLQYSGESLLLRVFFSSVHNVVLPTNQQCYVIYRFKCRFETDYVDKIIPQLGARIVEHMSGFRHRHSLLAPGKIKQNMSAIWEHLLISVTYSARILYPLLFGCMQSYININNTLV